MKMTSSAKSWEELTLADNFIFCKIMESNPDLCKHLLEILLHIEIDHLEAPQAERTFQESIDSKSVRFDVYTKDDERIFDLEIQTTKKKNLPKRARYYHSVIDVSNLHAGVNYKELKETYIIFICLGDVFGKGLPVYSFENICSEDKTTKLNDGAYKIFFNASDCDKIESADEKAFFKFLKGDSADDEFTKHLEEKVLLAKKNLEWRNQYMTIREAFDEEIEEAVEARVAEIVEERVAEAVEAKVAEAVEGAVTEAKAVAYEDGERNKALETARILKQSGVDLALIEKSTGLSAQEIEAL